MTHELDPINTNTALKVRTDPTFSMLLPCISPVTILFRFLPFYSCSLVQFTPLILFHFFFYFCHSQAHCQARLEYSSNILLSHFTESNANRLARYFSSALYCSPSTWKEIKARSMDSCDLEVKAIFSIEYYHIEHILHY